MLASDLSTLESMRTDMFAELDYPDALNRSILTAVAAWKEFVALPEHIRRRFGYLPDSGNSGSGYESPDPEKKDFKHVFHTKLKDETWLIDQARRTGRDEAVLLVTTSIEAIKALEPFVAGFCTRLEREFDLGSFSEDFLADVSQSILRHLYYPPGARAVGEEIAVQHVDKGGFTLHNWESHPGVERLTLEGDWVPFPTRKGKAVMFGSLRLQHRSRNILKGMCHRVVLDPSAQATGRWSTVFFSNFRNSPYYDKQRLGSTQEHPLGFNYTMPWDEFEKLFAWLPD